MRQRPADEHDEPAVVASWVTYRAWRATALALVVVGVLVGWLLGMSRSVPTPAGAGEALGGVLVVTGVVALVASRRRWQALTQAIAAGRPPPATRLPLLVSCVVVMTGLAVVVLLVAGAGGHG